MPIEIADHAQARARQVIVAQAAAGRDAVDPVRFLRALEILRFDRPARIIDRYDGAELLVGAEPAPQCAVEFERLLVVEVIPAERAATVEEERRLAVERGLGPEVDLAPDRVGVAGIS